MGEKLVLSAMGFQPTGECAIPQMALIGIKVEMTKLGIDEAQGAVKIGWVQREVLDHPSKEALLASVAEQEVRNLFYKPARDWLKALRGRYKLKGLTRAHDDDLIETTLIRNCVVHNRGVADDRLEKQTGGRCPEGVQIGITRDTVMKATDIIRKFASAVDDTAVQTHLAPSGPK